MTAALGFQEYAKNAKGCETQTARRFGSPALIHQKKIGVHIECQSDSLRFPGIESRRNCPSPALHRRLHFESAQAPNINRRACRIGVEKFRCDCRWNEDFSVLRLQNR